MNAVNRSSKVRMKKNPFDLAIWRFLVIFDKINFSEVLGIDARMEWVEIEWI